MFESLSGMVSLATIDVGNALRLSLQVSLLATVCVTLVGGGLGYWLAKARFAGKKWVEAIVTLPLTLPPVVVGFYLLWLFGQNGILGKPLYDLTGWSLVFTWQGAVVAATIMALPLMTKTTKAALESVDSVYLQAAATLGQSPMAVLFRVWLPLAWKGILAGVVLSFARCLGEFGATLMVAGNIPGRTQTMPMAIYEAVQMGKDGLAFFLVAILSLVSMGIVLFSSSLNE